MQLSNELERVLEQEFEKNNLQELKKEARKLKQTLL